MGGTILRHNGNMRAKHEVAMDNWARGVGMAVDRSVGALRACGSEGGIWTRIGDMAGTMTSDVGAMTCGMEVMTGCMAMDRASWMWVCAWVKGLQGPQMGNDT